MWWNRGISLGLKVFSYIDKHVLDCSFVGEFLQQFGQEYIKGIGWEVWEDVQNTVASNSKRNDQKQLQYRDVSIKLRSKYVKSDG